MAYDTKALKKTLGVDAVPQYYGETADEYEVIKGANGAIRTMLYDVSGNPLLTAANPGVMKIMDGTDQLAINADGSVNTLTQLTGSIPTGTNTIGKVNLVGNNVKPMNNQSIANGTNSSSQFYQVDTGSMLAIVVWPNTTTPIRVDIGWSWDNAGVFLVERIIGGTLSIGKALIKPRAPFARITVYNDDSVSRTFQAWITHLPGVHSDEHFQLAPYVASQDCAIANTNYDIAVNANYGRHARKGFIKAAKGNTGTVSVAISSDGTTFTSFFPDLGAGEAIEISGEEVNIIRVKSTVAGDDVHVWMR